jgi:hypothetical protein
MPRSISQKRPPQNIQSKPRVVYKVSNPNMDMKREKMDIELEIDGQSFPGQMSLTKEQLENVEIINEDSEQRVKEAVEIMDEMVELNARLEDEINRLRDEKKNLLTELKTFRDKPLQMTSRNVTKIPSVQSKQRPPLVPQNKTVRERQRQYAKGIRRPNQIKEIHSSSVTNAVTKQGSISK